MRDGSVFVRVGFFWVWRLGVLGGEERDRVRLFFGVGRKV